MLTVENGKCNEFITLVNVRSKVKKHMLMLLFYNSNEFITLVNVRSKVKKHMLMLLFFNSIHKHHNEQIEILLFWTEHLIGWIWKCWNVLFQFCHLISFHCLANPGFRKCTIKRENIGQRCNFQLPFAKPFIIFITFNQRKNIKYSLQGIKVLPNIYKQC